MTDLSKAGERAVEPASNPDRLEAGEASLIERLTREADACRVLSRKADAWNAEELAAEAGLFDAAITAIRSASQLLGEAERVLEGFRLKEESIVGGTADSLVLKMPMTNIQAAAALLAKLRERAK